MYLEHFGLSSFPFSTAPDPRFYYPSAKHREALACLLYVIEQHKGFALITGEVGAGKTMLCRATLERLDDSIDAAVIVNTMLSPLEFLQAVAVEFGLDIEGMGKVALLNAMQKNLTQRHGSGRNAVLIVDEAQGLSLEVLEELRLMGNMETSVDKLLQIILLGQPELRRMIGRPELRALDQRMAVKFHLGTLGRDDVHAYIQHRLRLAGTGEENIFEPEARETVFEASGGVPRVVNVICDQAMLQAYVLGRERVGPEVLRRVVAEMEGYYMDERQEAGKTVATVPIADPDEQSVGGNRPLPEFDDFEALQRALQAEELSIGPSPDEHERETARYARGDLWVSLVLRADGDDMGLTLRVPLDGLVLAEEAELKLAEAPHYEKVAESTYIHHNEMDLTVRIRDERIALSARPKGRDGTATLPDRLEFMNDELATLLELLQTTAAKPSEEEPAETDVGTAVALPRVVSRGRGVVTLECPLCQTTVRVYEDEVGQSGKCPGCSATIYVPEEAFRPQEKTRNPSARPDTVPRPEHKGFKWLRMFPCLRGITKYSPFG